MNRSTPGLPVHHQLPEFTQTHVHQVSDAIQPSHPLSSSSPPSPNPSQHQSLFQWVNSSHEVAKVLEFQLLNSICNLKMTEYTGRCVHVICQYYTIFYKELEHLPILVSRGGSCKKFHMDTERQLYIISINPHNHLCPNLQMRKD